MFSTLANFRLLNACKEAGHLRRLLSSYVPRRALLYVPGSDERKIQKASSIDADLIVLDCEDGVASNQKENARKMIRSILDSKSLPTCRPEWGIRVNSVSSDLCESDLRAVLGARYEPPCILLPKVDTVQEMTWFSGTLKRLKLQTGHNVNLIIYSETAAGMMNLPEIVQTAIEMERYSPFKLVALVVGSDDYVADIGATRTSSCMEVLYARQRLVMIAKAFGLQAIDMVHIDFKDLDALRRSSEQGASWGFTGRQVIHPSQVSIVQSAYSPSQHKIDWASRLIDAFKAHQELGKGAFVFNSQMIDMPTVKQAENILSLANATTHVEVDK